MLKKFLSILTLFTFTLTGNLVYLPSSYALDVNDLPKPGVMVEPSANLKPVILKGVTVDPINPLKFTFLMDTGSGKQQINANDPAIKSQANALIKYFLTALTIPEKEMWVNLSPYEKNRIAPPALTQTQMGQDMLAQDYLLKQISASLMYPEKEVGKSFWDKVYSLAKERFGEANIPVNALNKVWIVADRADVLQQGNTAYVVGAHLKVMLEEDYTAQVANHISESLNQSSRHLAQQSPQGASPRGALPLRSDGTISENSVNQITSQVILPVLEKEVNEGEHFAPLRQMFYSMILASWYKQALKDSLLGKAYQNQNKVGGAVVASDTTQQYKIYERYLAAYKKGVFNFIKEDVSLAADQKPRKYFAGGLNVMQRPARVFQSRQEVPSGEGVVVDGAMLSIKVGLNADEAMLTVEQLIVPFLVMKANVSSVGLEDFLSHPVVSFTVAGVAAVGVILPLVKLWR